LDADKSIKLSKISLAHLFSHLYVVLPPFLFLPELWPDAIILVSKSTKMWEKTCVIF